MLHFIKKIFCRKKYTLEDILLNCVTKERLIKELQLWGTHFLKNIKYTDPVVEITFGLNHLRFIAYMNNKVYSHDKLNKFISDEFLISNEAEKKLVEFYQKFLVHKHTLSDRIGYQTITFIHK